MRARRSGSRLARWCGSRNLGQRMSRRLGRRWSVRMARPPALRPPVLVANVLVANAPANPPRLDRPLDLPLGPRRGPEQRVLRAARRKSWRQAPVPPICSGRPRCPGRERPTVPLVPRALPVLVANVQAALSRLDLPPRFPLGPRRGPEQRVLPAACRTSWRPAPVPPICSGRAKCPGREGRTVLLGLKALPVREPGRKRSVRSVLPLGLRQALDPPVRSGTRRRRPPSRRHPNAVRKGLHSGYPGQSPRTIFRRLSVRRPRLMWLSQVRRSANRRRV